MVSAAIGRLDALEDAERANATTFIDFTTSKMRLYGSRSKRSAKAAHVLQNIVPACCYGAQYAVEYAQHRLLVAYAMLFPSYIARSRQNLNQSCIIERIDMAHTCCVSYKRENGI